MSKLMISVAGIRGIVGDSLTSDVVTRYAAAFGTWLGGGLVMVGTDSRPSRDMVKQAAIAGLIATGCDITDLGIASTPTIQLWTEKTPEAVGGIALTASHNPVEWNALKLFDRQGYFLDADQGSEVQKLFQEQTLKASWDRLGKYQTVDDPHQKHIDAIMNSALIDTDAIRNRRFKVAVDAVGGAGGVLIVRLLETLGCQVLPIGCEPSGEFFRNPEPVPEALGKLCELVREKGADIGFALDPDGDRLAVVDDKGEPVGEEYSVVAAADYVLQKRSGPVVVNLSTTQAIDDVAGKYKIPIIRTMVGESHVAREMRKVNAVIGGEGNGGVMFPEIHTTRDAAVGIAIILQSLTESGQSPATLFANLPQYVIVKDKVHLRGDDAPSILAELQKRWADSELDARDGLKKQLTGGWIQVRASNTEPILRIFAEAKNGELAREYLENTIMLIREIMSIKTKKAKHKIL
jgi:phosphomannomutase